MRKPILLSLGSFLALGFFLLSCAPRVAPEATPAPGRPVTPVTPALAVSPTLTPEEAEWQKVLGEARKEGKLTMYTFSFTGDPGRKLAKAFLDRYGIQIEYVGGLGSVLTERIKSERAAKKFIADTFDTATAILASAKEAGLTRSAGPLPVLKEEKVWRAFPRLDAEGHILSWVVSMNTPFVNTNLVRPGEEPKTYRELAEPKWKGKVVLGVPATTPQVIYYWVMRNNLGLSEDWFRQLAKNDTKFVSNVRESMQVVVTGEKAVVPTASGATFAEFIVRGAPVRAVAVEEGAISVLGIGISLIKDAPHPNAARVFANWLLSLEGQQVISEAASSTPVRADVKDFLPPAAQIQPKKVVPMTMADLVETGRIQRERQLDKIFGME